MYVVDWVILVEVDTVIKFPSTLISRCNKPRYSEFCDILSEQNPAPFLMIY